MIAWRWVAGGRAAPSGSSRWCHILALTCPGQAPHNSVVHPAARAKDRWHQLADAIRHSNLPASDKSVYGCLLAKTDYKTALLPPRFTPARQKIARETSISTRAGPVRDPASRTSPLDHRDRHDRPGQDTLLHPVNR